VWIFDRSGKRMHALSATAARVREALMPLIGARAPPR
jgi:hypothetical protein